MANAHAADLASNRIKSPADLLSLSLPEINTLLKEFGVKVKGNKSFKISRLCELLGLSSDEGSFLGLLSAIRNITDGWTKNIRKAPQVELHHISAYLLNCHQTTTHIDSSDVELFSPDNMKRYKTLRSYNLYRSKHVHSMSFLPMEWSQFCAVKGKCNPSWDTSGKVYDCIILFDNSKCDPIGSSCTCTAGQGEACTHVAAMLFALEDFTSLGHHQLPDDPASTELLCAWNGPVNPKVEAVPLKDLDFKQQAPLRQERQTKRKLQTFNPVALEKRSVHPEDYHALVHTLNMVQPDVPFLKIADPHRWDRTPPIPPTVVKELPDVCSIDSNLLTPASDITVHTTGQTPPTIKEKVRNIPVAERSIEALMTHLTLNTDERLLVEKITIAQNDSPEWFRYREGMVTASIIHDVYTKDKTWNTKRNETTEASMKKAVDMCLNSTKFQGNVKTKYGTANEGRAAFQYKEQLKGKHSNLKVLNCGLMVMEDHYFIGASLDRKVSCECHGDRVLEIKCPYSLKDATGSFLKLPYIKQGDTGDFILNPSHKYFSQVQCQMAVAKIPNADFVVWTPKQMLIIPIQFELSHWNRLLTGALDFFQHFLGPELMKVCDGTRDDSVKEGRKLFIDQVNELL